MKKWIVLGLTLVAMLTAIAAFAMPASAGMDGTYKDPKYDVNFGYVIENGEVTIINIYVGYFWSSTLTFPERIEGLPVTKIDIGGLAYVGDLKISGIKIPRYITQIRGLSRLTNEYTTEIVVDENSKNFKTVDNVLYSMDGKELVLCVASKKSNSFVIPAGVTTIGDGAFAACENLEEIVIPDSVTSIGTGAFNGTGYYNAQNWENGVLYIGKYLIAAEESLSGDYTIKSGTKIIADRAFEGCDKITNVDIPSSVLTIGNSAFNCCSGLKHVKIPNGVVSIGESAFRYGRFTTLEIPDSVISIGANAFEYCNKLTTIEIPDSVVSIGANAFASCSELTSVVIGKNVTSIGDEIFEFCYWLKRIYIDSASIVDQLISDDSCGGLIRDVQFVMINEHITSVSNYILDNFPYLATTMYSGKKYTSYGVWGVPEDHIHTFSTEWSNDEFFHWHECSICEDGEDWGDHLYSNDCDPSCNTCGYLRIVKHNYNNYKWLNDTTSHWRACTKCGLKKDESAHIPGDEATETTAQICTVCDYVIQDALGHTHEYEFNQKDDQFHWSYCSCGETTALDPHRWYDSEVILEPTSTSEGERLYTCIICGEQYTEVIEKLPSETDEPDADEDEDRVAWGDYYSIGDIDYVDGTDDGLTEKQLLIIIAALELCLLIIVVAITIIIRNKKKQG